MVCAALAIAPRADARRPPRFAPPGKGFWKVMVKPNAKWVLHDTIGENKKGTITVETYDVRTIDGADVARLRWTYSWGTKDTQDIGSTEMAKPTQVAVTAKGLYLLVAAMDDAAVSKALKGKPSRSDPPKAYAGTKLNKGRYLTTDDGLVCLGVGPTPDAGDCPDTCDGRVCWSEDGVEEISGMLAPGMSIFER